MWRVQLKLYLTLTLALLNTPITAKTGIKVPLRYHPEFGVYTTDITIGNQPPQTVEAIIDTGSSSMVFTTNEKYCPNCNQALTKGVVDPEKIGSDALTKTVHLTYGSAKDSAIEYLAPIQYSKEEKTSLMMKIFLLKDSDQPTSIIGMIHHNMRRDQVDYVPFMVKITDNFNKYHELSLLLCAERGASYYYIGPKQFSKHPHQSKLLKSPFYEVNTSGLYDAANQPVAKTQAPFQGAILDTGTGGFILLTPELYRPLHTYIYQHAGKKNQQLSADFWQKNYCILKQEVNFSALPKIKIGFQDASSKQPYFLMIPPTTYLSQAGCGEGYVRLVFTPGLPLGHPVAIRNHLSRLNARVRPAMVIGTSLLNHYAISIYYQPNPRIEFSENHALCHPKQDDHRA